MTMTAATGSSQELVPSTATDGSDVDGGHECPLEGERNGSSADGQEAPVMRSPMKSLSLGGSIQPSHVSDMDDFGSDPDSDGEGDHLLDAIDAELEKRGESDTNGNQEGNNVYKGADGDKRTADDGQKAGSEPAAGRSREEPAAGGSREEPAAGGSRKEPVGEELVEESLESLIEKLEEAVVEKIEESDENRSRRLSQLRGLVDELVRIDPRSSGSRMMQGFLSVKREEIQTAVNRDRAVKRWRELIEDLDDEVNVRRKRQEIRVERKRQIAELKERKEMIPRELTKKQGAKYTERLKQAHLEIVKVKKRISHLQSRTLSFDDLADDHSVFIREDRMKRRLCSLVKKIEKMEGYRRKDHRPMFRPIKYTSSLHSDINEEISKQVTKIIREKRLEPSTRLRGMVPDFKDIFDIVASTRTGKSMKEDEIRAESQIIFKEIMDEMRGRREAETEEFFDQYESDEEIGVKDVHEIEDEELEKKLLPLDQIDQSYQTVVQSFVSRAELMSEEELRRVEEEAVKEEEEEERAAAEKGSKDGSSDEDELDDEEAEDEAMESNQEGQSSNLQESRGDQERDEEGGIERVCQEEVVDLASDQEEEGRPETRGFDVAFGPDSHSGSSSPVAHGGPRKKLRTAMEVEEITLSSDED